MTREEIGKNFRWFFGGIENKKKNSSDIFKPLQEPKRGHLAHNMVSPGAY